MFYTITCRRDPPRWSDSEGRSGDLPEAARDASTTTAMIQLLTEAGPGLGLPPRPLPPLDDWASARWTGTGPGRLVAEFMAFTWEIADPAGEQYKITVRIYHNKDSSVFIRPVTAESLERAVYRSYYHHAPAKGIASFEARDGVSRWWAVDGVLIDPTFRPGPQTLRALIARCVRAKGAIGMLEIMSRPDAIQANGGPIELKRIRAAIRPLIEVGMLRVSARSGELEILWGRS